MVKPQFYSSDMAWWNHIIFLEENLESHNARLFEEKPSLGFLYRVIKQYIYDNFIIILRVILKCITYIYLGIVAVTFFFPTHVPHVFIYIIDVFSEPYLGALGVYVVVNEIERRRTEYSRRRTPELFPVLWFLFLIVASVATYYSNYFRTTGLYQTVVTNALAVMIIRIGTLIRY